MSKIHYKINEDHIALARTYFEEFINQITIKKFLSFMETIKPTNRLLRSGIYYLMRRLPCYSYKKAHVT